MLSVDFDPLGRLNLTPYSPHSLTFGWYASFHSGKVTAKEEPSRAWPVFHPDQRSVDETGEWEVVGRPYTTNAGKDVHVHVRRVDNTEVTMIRTYAAHERISVKRASAKDGKR
jgi:hypothetical protein